MWQNTFESGKELEDDCLILNLVHQTPLTSSPQQNKTGLQPVSRPVEQILGYNIKILKGAKNGANMSRSQSVV